MIQLFAQYANVFLEKGQRQTYKKNDIIFEENKAPLAGIYYLLEGFIQISILSNAQRKIIDFVGKQQLFGEHVLDGEQYFSTAKALTPCVVYFLPLEDVQECMRTDRLFQQLLYSSVIEKLQILSTNIVLRSNPAEKIVANKILYVAEKFQSPVVPFTKQMLCQFTSLNRLTVYSVLKKWGA